MSDTAAMTKSALSDRETQILLLAWAECLEEKPKIDYNKLTTLLGSKSVASATKTYQNALKKLVGSDVSSLPTAGAGSGEKAGTPAGKKKRAASEATDEETPKKRGRKPKAKGETEEAEKGEEGKDEGEGEGVKDEPVSDGEEI